jgi:hypothetical protein
MRLPWGLAPRHVLAAALGITLLVLPLYILSFDPESRLERLRTPLCRGGMVVNATNQNGGPDLIVPDSGIKLRATKDDEPIAVHVELLVREPDRDWRLYWSLDADDGTEIFFLPNVKPGWAAQIRAIDPTGRACPADSPILRAPTA